MRAGDAGILLACALVLSAGPVLADACGGCTQRTGTPGATAGLAGGTTGNAIQRNAGTNRLYTHRGHHHCYWRHGREHCR